MDNKYRINHLRELEAESMYVIREVVAQFENPCMLFSGGKDSIIMFHLARKAFWPARVPFPLMHIDTGHNFKETIDFSGKPATKDFVETLIELGKREYQSIFLVIYIIMLNTVNNPILPITRA